MKIEWFLLDKTSFAKHKYFDRRFCKRVMCPELICSTFQHLKCLVLEICYGLRLLTNALGNKFPVSKIDYKCLSLQCLYYRLLHVIL